MTKDVIIKALKSVVGDVEVNLEFPENEEFGDYSSNIALTMFSKFQTSSPKSQSLSNSEFSKFKTPRELAEEIVKRLALDSSLKAVVDRIQIAGPGFINFWLKKEVLVDNLMQIDKQKEKYGSSDLGKGKTVIIDYSSPNIAKPFGIGHLRSTIIGQALYNFYEFLGCEVVGDNHLGDWGTQFGVLLSQISKIPDYKSQISNWTVNDLEEMYVEFHQKVEDNPELQNEAKEWFKKLEEGDKEAKEIWQACVDVSQAEFNRIYEILGVKIDFAFGESYYESEMKQLMAASEIKNHLSEGEGGAQIIDLTKQGISTPLMFLKGDRGTTYATRDLATITFRVRKWNPDLIIYEVGAEQVLHFKQLFAAARLLGMVDEKVELVHTAHGLYLAPDGKKFSTREGKTIKLEEVLDEAISRAEKLGNKGEVAKEVGIGAIKYFDLMHGVTSNVVFDWEKIMNLEGNSGPYLQYTFARTQSVLGKSKRVKEQESKSFSNKTAEQLNSEELAVLRSLSRFPEIIATAAKNYSPNLLCNYLFDLAQKYNGFYNKHKILGSKNQEFRIKLTAGTGQVLKNGLKLLGIETPEKM